MIAKFTKKSKPYFLWRKNIYASVLHYSERIGYDLNSNITSFSRRGYQRNILLQNGLHGKFYGLLDSLTVYYGGNQVRMVTDAVTTDYGHPAEYRYDIAAKVIVR